MMRIKLFLACALLVLAAAPVSAQPEPRDPMEQYLFAPELLMRNQRVLALDEAQRAAIKEEVRKAESEFAPLDWDLQNEMAALGELLKGERVDEKRALELLDTILDLEKKLKRIHLALLVRLKNRLSAEQQARLYELRGR